VKSSMHIIGFHKHLHDGTKSNAVSGWVLYASFYYVLGQYNTTLKIIDHVLSRCTPDMIKCKIVNYTTNDIKYYTHNIGQCDITTGGTVKLPSWTSSFSSWGISVHCFT
jgi:hypothetical protein